MNLLQRYVHNLLDGLIGPLRLLLEQRDLLTVLAKRDIVARTSGTLLGGLWMLAQPALQVLAFWFLLGFVLRVRFPGQVSFINYFLLGMLPWLMISEVISRNLAILTEFSTLYQRSTFPIKILPLLPLLVSGMIYSVIYAVVVALTEGFGAALWSPLVIFGVLLWLMPFSYVLAVLGVFIRDMRAVIRCNP